MCIVKCYKRTQRAILVCTSSGLSSSTTKNKTVYKAFQFKEKTCLFYYALWQNVSYKDEPELQQLISD